MIISPTSFQQATFYYTAPPQESAADTRVKPPDNSEKKSFIRKLDAFTAFFERQSEALREKVNVKAISRLNFASVSSSDPLVLADISTPTTLKSTESINTTLTNEYTPDQPNWAGDSDADPRARGTYDGSQGTDTLTFTVTQPGNVEGPYTGLLGLPALIEVEVRTSDDTLVDTILFSESDTAATPRALSNGMTIEFAAGTMEQDDSFTIDVSSVDIETADPGRSMKLQGDGTTDANFDPGLFVVDGAFDINGVTINVDENDSVDDVVDLINESAAGVTASYNSVTDEFELVQNTAGSSGEIDLENDTSGFFDAVKLTGAVPVPGTDSATEVVISDVPELSSLASGNFLVNGTSITMDVDTDTLSDVIARINESEAEAVASFANGVMTIRSERVDMSLELDDNGTNFFDVFSITVGSYAGENIQRTTGLRRGAETLELQFGKFEKTLSELLAGGESAETSASASSVRESLKASVLAALKNTLNLEPSDVETDGVIDTGLGIRFDFSETAENLVEVDFEKMLDVLRRKPSRLMKFIFQEAGGQKDSGLLEAIADQLDVTKRKLANALGANSGLHLDVFA